MSGKGEVESVRDFRDLRVWQDAMELVVVVYGITRRFPREEQYVLSAQMRRSALSVPSNIAEGNARRGRREYLQFLGIASGSLAELRTQAEVAIRLGFISRDASEPALALAERIGRRLTALRRRLLWNS